MANRATPYTFATNYVAFWELSFLPAWTITGLDAFFPLLALKSIALLALAAWLAGRAFGLRAPILLWTIAASLTLRHFWLESSGVGTLKNDALHGALTAARIFRGSPKVAFSSVSARTSPAATDPLPQIMVLLLGFMQELLHPFGFAIHPLSANASFLGGRPSCFRTLALSRQPPAAALAGIPPC